MRRSGLCIGVIGAALALAFLLTGIESQPVSAHPGGLAGDGCHYCRTNCARWGYTAGTRHCHRAPAPRQTVPRPTPTPTVCNSVPSRHLVIDSQGRVAVPRQLAPGQPDGDNDGYACGGQLEHKRHLVPPTPTPRPTAIPTHRPTPSSSADHPVVPKRSNGDSVRYTPTNEMYGMCRARFPYSHLEDCNIDYDFLMQFWLDQV